MGKPRFSAKWFAAGLMSAALIASVPGSAQNANRGSGTGGEAMMHDGMHGAEKARAMRGLERSRSDRARNRTAGERGQDQEQRAVSAAPIDPALLLLERRREKGATARLADAWYYDYASNETIHKVVDLESGDVVSSEVVVEMQLPLIDEEISRAFDILLASPADQKALSRAFKEVTGEVFEDRRQVSYKAFVFHPDTVAEGLSRSARRCGINRCAQMLIYTHDNVALDMSPVVDLSVGRVLQNLELRAREIVRRVEAAQ